MKNLKNKVFLWHVSKTDVSSYSTYNKAYDIHTYYFKNYSSKTKQVNSQTPLAGHFLIINNS